MVPSLSLSLQVQTEAEAPSTASHLVPVGSCSVGRTAKYKESNATLKQLLSIIDYTDKTIEEVWHLNN